MQRTRANFFKLALRRYCRQPEVQLRADACAINLRNKDPIKFWQSVKKASNRNYMNFISPQRAANNQIHSKIHEKRNTDIYKRKNYDTICQ